MCAYNLLATSLPSFGGILTGFSNWTFRWESATKREQGSQCEGRHATGAQQEGGGGGWDGVAVVKVEPAKLLCHFVKKLVAVRGKCISLIRHQVAGEAVI